jgi:hypothetical protein
MKSYHITPEHALKIFDEAGGILDIDDKCPLAVSATDLANTINLALDQVLGEHVAEVIGQKVHRIDWEYEHILVTMTIPSKNLRVGTKLYAPKEQS